MKNARRVGTSMGLAAVLVAASGHAQHDKPNTKAQGAKVEVVRNPSVLANASKRYAAASPALQAMKRAEIERHAKALAGYIEATRPTAAKGAAKTGLDVKAIGAEISAMSKRDAAKGVCHDRSCDALKALNADAKAFDEKHGKAIHAAAIASGLELDGERKALSAKLLLPQ